MRIPSRYRERLDSAGFSLDAAQRAALTRLSRLHDALCRKPPPPSLAGRLKRFIAGPVEKTPVQGVYLWGGVGRGKTFLMDLFFDALPFSGKMRSHFHRFMGHVHDDLNAIGDVTDPLTVVADRLAERARIICFDEFFVSDIADAMILGTLFDALFARGVTLVATSNVPPSDLYRDGLQRQRFLPAIALLERYTDVVEVDGGVDYRLRVLEAAELYHTPLDATADTAMRAAFDDIAPDPGHTDHPLEIDGRIVPHRERADGIIWFDFDQICAGPRGVSDYIEIARSFQTVIVSNVPVLDAEREDEARRFIAMVDEFYDRRVKLIVSAAADIDTLYTGRRLGFEFERTRSRLTEMRSHDYLAAAHVP